MNSFTTPSGRVLSYELWLGLEQYVVTDEHGARLFMDSSETEAQEYIQAEIAREEALLAPRFINDKGSVLDNLTGQRSVGLDPALLDYLVNGLNSADAHRRATGAVAATYVEADPRGTGIDYGMTVDHYGYHFTER